MKREFISFGTYEWLGFKAVIPKEVRQLRKRVGAVYQPFLNMGDMYLLRNRRKARTLLRKLRGARDARLLRP